MRAVSSSTAARLPVRFQGPEPLDTTLLDLVGAICDVTSDDQEVVATVLDMLRSGQVRLRGNFRGQEDKVA